eukprot:TRINITY_DN5648_c0_g1_i2.p1 TRINITY_DN5648_c0_g1~~TRINITY_DN5648_c0_g1_i2.p1  ORF type:complete len:305 (-),score=83.94 TRINITY_DN5648_c0_g1_i2:794-1708(-)
MRRLSRDYGQFSTNNQLLMETNEEVRQQLSEMELKYHALLATYQQFQNQYDEENVKSTESTRFLNLQLNQLNEHVKQLEEELRENETMAHERELVLEQSHSQIFSRVEALSNENNQLQSHVEELEELVTQQSTQVTELKQENKNLRMDNKQFQIQVQQLLESKNELCASIEHEKQASQQMPFPEKVVEEKNKLEFKIRELGKTQEQSYTRETIISEEKQIVPEESSVVTVKEEEISSRREVENPNVLEESLRCREVLEAKLSDTEALLMTKHRECKELRLEMERLKLPTIEGTGNEGVFSDLDS